MMKEDTKSTIKDLCGLIISFATALMLIVSVVLRFFVKKEDWQGLGIDDTLATVIQVALVVASVVAGWYAKDSWRKAKDKWSAWYKSYKMRRIPEINWGNDGFAYMTVESRFKDNFNKSGLKFNIDDIKPRPKDQYSYFADKKVLDENMLKTIFPQENETSVRKISPREDYCANYKEYMSKLLAPYKEKKQSYLFSKAPFIFAEHYYFYSILYYMRDNTNRDPWKETKKNQYRSLEKRIENLANEKDLGEILKSCVNSNSTDLSQNQQNIDSYTENTLVIDHIEKFKAFVKGNNLLRKNVHIIVDNCGIELISDMILGLYMLEQLGINELYLHFNILPIFVSDVIKSDVEDAMELIAGDGKDENRNEIVRKYRKYREEGRIIETADVFWNMPIPFKNAPEAIMHDVFNAASTGLVIFKGDLNYRRLVEDRQWKINELLEDRIKYIKNPVLVLRSLKSNVLLGVDCETSSQKDEAYPSWKTTGDFGIIQFVDGK